MFSIVLRSGAKSLTSGNVIKISDSHSFQEYSYVVKLSYQMSAIPANLVGM